MNLCSASLRVNGRSADDLGHLRSHCALQILLRVEVRRKLREPFCASEQGCCQVASSHQVHICIHRSETGTSVTITLSHVTSSIGRSNCLGDSSCRRCLAGGSVPGLISLTVRTYSLLVNTSSLNTIHRGSACERHTQRQNICSAQVAASPQWVSAPAHGTSLLGLRLSTSVQCHSVNAVPKQSRHLVDATGKTGRADMTRTSARPEDGCMCTVCGFLTVR